MGLRKLERNIVKKQGSMNSFKDRWQDFRKAKYGEGNVPRNTMKKKQRHFDDPGQFVSALKWQKNMINTYWEKRAEKDTDVDVASKS